MPDIAALLEHNKPAHRTVAALYTEEGLTFNELQAATNLTTITQAWTLHELQEENLIYAENYLATTTNRRTDDKTRYRFTPDRFSTVPERLGHLEAAANNQKTIAYYDWLLEQTERKSPYIYGNMGVPETLLEKTYGDAATESFTALAAAGLVEHGLYTAEDLRWEPTPHTLEPAAADTLLRETVAGTFYRPTDNIYTALFAALR